MGNNFKCYKQLFLKKIFFITFIFNETNRALKVRSSFTDSSQVKNELLYEQFQAMRAVALSPTLFFLCFLILTGFVKKSNTEHSKKPSLAYNPSSPKQTSSEIMVSENYPKSESSFHTNRTQPNLT